MVRKISDFQFECSMVERNEKHGINNLSLLLLKGTVEYRVIIEDSCHISLQSLPSSMLSVNQISNSWLLISKIISKSRKWMWEAAMGERPL